MKRFLLSLTIISVIALSSCSDDDIQIPNEEELITTLIYTLTPASGGSSVEFRFQDLDGDGGNAPVITSGTLQANSSYTGSVSVLNEAETPAEDITEEVEEESAEHQFFFELTSQVNAVITYNDQDTNGDPVGLETTMTTADPSTGQLIITLRHEPDKSAAGVAEGNIANAGGETDIQVTFEIQIQ